LTVDEHAAVPFVRPTPSLSFTLGEVSMTMAAAMAVVGSIKDNSLVEDSNTPLLL
jgi:hypothetical protein